MIDMNKWLELMLGLILIVVPIYLAFMSWGNSTTGWGLEALTFLRGGIFWAIVGLGALFVLLGISDLKG